MPPLVVICTLDARRAARLDAHVRLERTRPNVFTVTATGEELSALVAGARMAADVMRQTPGGAAPGAAEMLERVLEDFDRARVRLAGHDEPTGPAGPDGG
jgi:hypothetical protein